MVYKRGSPAENRPGGLYSPETLAERTRHTREAAWTGLRRGLVQYSISWLRFMAHRCAATLADRYRCSPHHAQIRSRKDPENSTATETPKAGGWLAGR